MDLSSLQASTIDDTAVSPVLLDQVDCFEVGDSTASNHYPLKKYFNNSIFLAPTSESTEDFSPGYRRHRWTEQLHNMVALALEHDDPNIRQQALLQLDTILKRERERESTQR